MPHIVLSSLVILSFVLLCFVNNQHVRPEINAQDLQISKIFQADFRREGIRFAVIGDLHVGDQIDDYEDLSLLLETVKRSNPDLILLLGDYTASSISASNMDTHRQEVSRRLSVLNSYPVAGVLGNYETLSQPSKWKNHLSAAGIVLLHNEVTKIDVKGEGICIRGLGDTFTRQFQFVDFPDDCNEFPRITITHDPAAAFNKGVEGIIFAAHTHCGQVRLPWVGALWIPTEAPRDATCGRYEDEKRLVWVTSGVGVSILPVRIGAQAQWDLLTLTL